ncbi:MAG: tRNA 2-selenouridine(34) synthase MnmH [Bacteroidetes bacterium HGW-Bacteroidetes-6]|jgi:tRNA 2-selenouridine synthase|nr:MAG: tRNA 2-selenouridine(34) synthase MnmH [Bacteroidetes bacterium HGW-Bacteroidetes-6]
MLHEIDISNYFDLGLPLIDVRSPGEYSKGHVPGAMNIALFSDDERAHIGTVYVQQSQEKAIELGYHYANPKRSWYIDEARKIAPDGKIVVHCWRGGMRSRLFAQHLHDNGFSDVHIIVGGYKKYRNYVLNSFAEEANIRVIGGYTGSGKTLVLKQLQKENHQVIDLEGLANHKGSAFGAFGFNMQPRTEQFENNLFEIWRKLDKKKPIWIEDESIGIGTVFIPRPLFLKMRSAPLYFLDIEREIRAAFLVNDYTNLPIESLANSFQKISKKLGSDNVAKAIDCLNRSDLFSAAMIALVYYDRSYSKGLQSHNSLFTVFIPSKTTNPIENTRAILEQYGKHQ